MPSVRLELTTFRLWDWRANQLRQEGWIQQTMYKILFQLSCNNIKNQLHVLKDDLSNQQISVVATTKKLENEIGNKNIAKCGQLLNL